uniref:Palmitoyltransferase n=1 Tax=Chromera velia CCMP2878 TaxID=1169474 RepID=A0A0G4FDN6_9ALVE|eukprot:Cvel_3215.t1-p1 / transcript=Cvel_3215.t1 / gene=Cvel_3215 / organism=Chromera_velia_CCMP2878 / gene_product=Palmitoyltransferase ZDHHC5, putative / transcript_product=Palmitoyltransferase ZDHHC5, putative / location=Cvel_scaffold125:118718-124721(+) / protein_length=620 / sequence_SO=supercontig / SO=protein_coding / is_pseudo=false
MPDRRPLRDGNVVTEEREMEIWEAWEGEGTRWFCCGRCMTGPGNEWCANACAWTFLLVLPALYFIFLAPPLWEKVSPAIPLATAALFVTAVFFLCFTQCSDPGVIPRRGIIQAFRIHEEVSSKLAYEPCEASDSPAPAAGGRGGSGGAAPASPRRGGGQKGSVADVCTMWRVCCPQTKKGEEGGDRNEGAEGHARSPRLVPQEQGAMTEAGGKENGDHRAESAGVLQEVEEAPVDLEMGPGAVFSPQAVGGPFEMRSAEAPPVALATVHPSLLANVLHPAGPGPGPRGTRPRLPGSPDWKEGDSHSEDLLNDRANAASSERCSPSLQSETGPVDTLEAVGSPARLRFDWEGRHDAPPDTVGGGHGEAGEEEEAGWVPTPAEGYRYCNTCEVIRPPRSAHCSYCGNCVMRHDHHCAFMNNCIGQRNFHGFVGFLCSALFLGVAVVAGLVLYMFTVAAGSGLRTEVVIAITVTIGFLVLCAVVAVCILLVTHLILIVRGKTTREALKARNSSGPTFFQRRGPALFNPKTSSRVRIWIEEGHTMEGRHLRRIVQVQAAGVPPAAGTTEQKPQPPPQKGGGGSGLLAGELMAGNVELVPLESQRGGQGGGTEERGEDLERGLGM